MLKKRFLRYNLSRDNTHEYASVLNNNFIDFHIKSFNDFLQGNIDHKQRLPIGLQGIILDFFPITPSKSTIKIDFVHSIRPISLSCLGFQ